MYQILSSFVYKNYYQINKTKDRSSKKFFHNHHLLLYLTFSLSHFFFVVSFCVRLLFSLFVPCFVGAWCSIIWFGKKLKQNLRYASISYCNFLCLLYYFRATRSSAWKFKFINRTYKLGAWKTQSAAWELLQVEL